MKALLITACLVAAVAAGPWQRGLIYPSMTGPASIIPETPQIVMPDMTGPASIIPDTPQLIMPDMTGPAAIIPDSGSVSPAQPSPVQIDPSVPAGIGPALIEEFAPVNPAPTGPAVIDFAQPDNVISIPGPDGQPLVQIIVNVVSPAASPIHVETPTLPGPVNVVDNILVPTPESGSLGIPTSPELEIAPAIVMPDLLN